MYWIAGSRHSDDHHLRRRPPGRNGVYGHGRPLQPGHGSRHSDDHHLRRRPPGRNESEPSSWFQRQSDKFWNSVIPGWPTLAKVVVGGSSALVIALGLGLYLFICISRRFNREILRGTRMMGPRLPSGLLSTMLSKLVGPTKKQRDIEEGDDDEEQSRPFSSSWWKAASKVEYEQAREESEEDSSDEEESDVEPKRKSAAMKKYLAKTKRLKSHIKDKKAAMKKELKEAKTILAKKTKNIKVKNIKAKKTKNLNVSKNMAKKTKKTKVRKLKNIKRRK